MIEAPKKEETKQDTEDKTHKNSEIFKKLSKNSQKLILLHPSKPIKIPFRKEGDFLCRNFLFQKGLIALQDS